MAAKSSRSRRSDERRGDRRPLPQAHDLRVVGAAEGRPHPGRARGGRLLLDAGGQALPRLQQPAHVHEHRPLASEGGEGHPGAGGHAWPTRTRSWPRKRGRGWARSWPRSRPATSTPSSSRTAARKRWRTRSAWRAWSPGATRSSSAIARTTAARRARCTLTGDPRRWASEPGIPGVVRIPDFHRWGKKDPEPVAEVLARHRRRHPLRRRPHHRRHHRGDGRRHERHPHPARRVHAGPAQDLRRARHPAHRGRSDGRLRAHGPHVRHRPLGRRARPHDHGQGPDVGLRAARRGGHAPGHRARLPGEGVPRRAHLQQPSPRLRGRAGHPRRLRGGRLIDNARARWARC